MPIYPLIFIIPDYDRLRIGALILASLIVVGGLSVILCKLIKFLRFLIL